MLGAVRGNRADRTWPARRRPIEDGHLEGDKCPCSDEVQQVLGGGGGAERKDFLEQVLFDLGLEG